MSTRHAATDSPHGADDLLANLIEDITQALERGEPVDLEAYTLTYPEHAERIRRLVPAVLLLENVGSREGTLGCDRTLWD